MSEKSFEIYTVLIQVYARRNLDLATESEICVENMGLEEHVLEDLAAQAMIAEKVFTAKRQEKIQAEYRVGSVQEIGRE